jgi:hypothetical protein
MATLEWVDWYNNQRLFSTIGNTPPAEAEANHYLTTTPSVILQMTQPASTKPGAVQVAAELNARPRKRLGFETPAEALHQLMSDPTESVASTA